MLFLVEEVPGKKEVGKPREGNERVFHILSLSDRSRQALHGGGPCQEAGLWAGAGLWPSASGAP